MKKQLKTWEIIDNLADEVRNGLDNEDYEIVASLIWDLAFKTAMYAIKRRGIAVRWTWPNVKKILPTLIPPLKKDYTNLLSGARAINKDARYADDMWEFDTDFVRIIAEEVLDLVEDVRQLAI
jgi:hypothetical protein